MTSAKFARKTRGVCRVCALAVLISLVGSVAYAAHRTPPPGECPQPRFTGKAPSELYARVNPLENSSGNRRAGKKLYEDLSDPSCTMCHGKKGDGKGPLAGQFHPPPRNFSCADTVETIPDGQLYWIIHNGSTGTAMPSFDYLSEEEIWQLVIYLRSLTGHSEPVNIESQPAEK